MKDNYNAMMLILRKYEEKKKINGKNYKERNLNVCRMSKTSKGYKS